MGNDRLNYRVKRELISFLYASGSYALPAQLIAMLLVAWMVRSWVPERLWSAWFAISLLGWLCRTFHLVWRRFHRLVSRIRLEYEYFIGSTCAAIFWAMGLLFFMSYLPEPQRMLLVLLSCLYITACAVLLLNSRNCFYGALLPIGLVLSFELLAEPSSTSGVTLMILLFIILFAELLRRRILHWQTTGLHNRFLSAEMASQLRRRTESLRIASQQDGLTAIANRGKFEEQLEVQWRRCARAAAPLSLLLLDVDYFKQFNDKYGHQAGDDCLRQVAAVLKQALRRGGVCLVATLYRFAGRTDGGRLGTAGFGTTGVAPCRFFGGQPGDMQSGLCPSDPRAGDCTGRIGGNGRCSPVSCQT